MGANKSDFATGHGKTGSSVVGPHSSAPELASTPSPKGKAEPGTPEYDYRNVLNVPQTDVDESGILKPSADRPQEAGAPVGITPEMLSKVRGTSSISAVSPEKAATTASPLASRLDDIQKQTNKRPVSMQDTISIARSLHAQLLSAHDSLALSLGHSHSSLIAARVLLKGNDTRLGAGQLLDSADDLRKSGADTPKAWEQIDTAGKNIHKAYKSLLTATGGNGLEIGHAHPVNGSTETFTPGSELLRITSQPSKFNPKGKMPQTILVNGVRVPAARAKRAIVEDRAAKAVKLPTRGLRPELTRPIEEDLKGTPRTRKSERVIGPDLPASKRVRPAVEPLGEVAVQPSRVGDYSGAEKARNLPESVIDKVDAQREQTLSSINPGVPVKRAAKITKNKGN